MSVRLEIAEALEKQPVKGKVFIGWDGNTDEIIEVVNTREGMGRYQAMETMDVMGMRIVKAAGKSCNIELVPKKQKIGGNGPILCRALLEGGHAITLVGVVGEPIIEPLFKIFEKRCERVISLGPSAYTQALEFADGKVMLGKLQSFDNITWDNLLQRIPLPELIALHDDLDLFVSANWTMLLDINRIWRKIAEEVVPHLSKRKRWMFVDLADPAKRTDEDLREALDILSALTKGYQVVLGLNESEEGRVAHVLGVFSDQRSRENIGRMAEEIRAKLGLAHVVCHSTHYAVAADGTDTYVAEGPYVERPVISTGAGDNFNAGYCNALLHGLSTKACVTLGVAASGYYVREGHSPTMKELAEFLRLWQTKQLK